MARRTKAKTAAAAPQTRTDSAGTGAGIGMSRPHQIQVDSMQNLVSGMGTEKDKMFSTFFGLGLMPRDQLDAAYRGDWIARKAIDIPAEDATREWREWQADPDDVSEIETIEKDLNIQEKVKQAMIRGRLYGGGALVLGVEQGKPEDELVLETLDTGCLKFVHVVSRYELHAGETEWDVLSPYYGEPKYYEQASQASSGMRLHPSRVVRFIGKEIPDPALANGWGDSVLQSVSDAVMGAGLVTSSVAQLVGEAKLDVIKIPGLSENISNTEYETRLKKRFGFANVVKSVYSMLLLDKEEEWQRIESKFAGLDEILKMYLMMACGAVDIPATRFLGQSPQGLSATGDSDTRNYYDRVTADQKNVIQPKLNRLDEVIIRSALGRMPDEGEGDNDDIHYNWRPLWQMTETEKADVANKKATTAKADNDMGLINTVVLKKAREAQLVADGTYPGLEALIEEFDDDPELENQPEVLGGMLPPITDPNDPNYDPAQDPNSPEFANAPPKQIAPPAKQLASPKKSAAKGAKKAKASAAVDGMVRRMQDATTPRTLYVRRDLLNQKDVKAWARRAGFATSLTDMHVTIAYSKKAVDWIKAGSDDWGSDPDGNLTVKVGGPRVLEKFGKAVALAFHASALSYRHRRIIESCDATWDHDDYTPHVTITYEGGDVDIVHVAAYDGELRFGPEIFEEIKTGFNNEVDTVEDHNENHDPETGQFTTSKGEQHGAPITIGGKEKKSTHLSIKKGEKNVGEITSTVSARQTSVSPGAKYATGRGEIERFRAKAPDRPASYHNSAKEAEAYLKKWHKDDEAEDLLDYNENHDPESGQFSSGEGGGEDGILDKGDADVPDGDPKDLDLNDPEVVGKISPALKIRERSGADTGRVLRGKRGEVHADIASRKGLDSELIEGGVRAKKGRYTYERGFVHKKKYYSAEAIDLDTASLEPISKHAARDEDDETKDYNENHDPETGQFSSGEGVGSGGAPAVNMNIDPQRGPTYEQHKFAAAAMGKTPMSRQKFAKSQARRKRAGFKVHEDDADIGEMIADALANMPAPNITVNVDGRRAGKEVTKVIHDERGRIIGTEKTEEEST